MVGSHLLVKKRKTTSDWVSGLLGSDFFGQCDDHVELRKNEKNLFCIDCNTCLCKHCVTSPEVDDCLHRLLLQICKYVYRDVVRLHDIQHHFDCSLIQAYKINGEKAVHLNPRPQLKEAKTQKPKIGGTCCESCGRHIQDQPNRFCSIACKVSTNADNRKANNPSSKLDQLLPNLETEESSCNENECASSSVESSYEVMHTWLSSAARPRKRKSSPRRAPIC